MNIRTLSDQDLKIRTRAAGVSKRTSLCLELSFFAEIDRRKLYHASVHPNLWNTLTVEYGLHRSDAGRKIGIIRLMSTLSPEKENLLIEFLEKGQLHIEGFNPFLPKITATNLDEWIATLAGRTTEELDQIFATHFGTHKKNTSKKDYTKAKFVIPHQDPKAKPASEFAHPTAAVTKAEGDSGKAASSSGHDSTSAHNSPTTSGETANPVSGETANPVSGETPNPVSGETPNPVSGETANPVSGEEELILEKTIEILITLRGQTREDFEAIKQCYPGKSTTTILQEAIALFRKKRVDPKVPRPKSQGGGSSNENSAKQPTSPLRKRAYIPVAIRDEVRLRDENQCTFVTETGERCCEKGHLELDHITPFAMGGRNTVENLRLLCWRHNQYMAEKYYGKSFMNEKRSRPSRE